MLHFFHLLQNYFLQFSCSFISWMQTNRQLVSFMSQDCFKRYLSVHCIPLILDIVHHAHFHFAINLSRTDVVQTVGPLVPSIWSSNLIELSQHILKLFSRVVHPCHDPDSDYFPLTSQTLCPWGWQNATMLPETYRLFSMPGAFLLEMLAEMHFLFHSTFSIVH